MGIEVSLHTRTQREDPGPHRGCDRRGSAKPRFVLPMRITAVEKRDDVAENRPADENARDGEDRVRRIREDAGQEVGLRVTGDGSQCGGTCQPTESHRRLPHKRMRQFMLEHVSQLGIYHVNA